MSGIIIGGLTTGCLYALVGLGLILIFRTSGALNLAQGATAAAGAFLALGLVSAHLPVGLAAVAGIAAAALLNVAVYLACVWRLERRGADTLATLVSTLGATLVITGGLQLLAGFDSHTLRLFPRSGGPRLAGVTVPPVAMVIVGSALLAFCLLALVLYRTRLGLALRMGASSAELTALSGIGTTRLRLLVWLVAGVLSGWGIILFSDYQTLNTSMADTFLLASAVVASWGAFRNIPLTLTGAIGLGIATNLVQRFVPVVLVSSVSLVLLVVVFLVWQRRQGTLLVRAVNSVRRQPRALLKRLPWAAPAELATLGVIGLVVWWYGSAYQLTLVRHVAATLIAVVGVSISARYGHRLNLASGGFMLLGAYTAGIVGQSLPLPLAIAGAVLLAALLGGVIGRITAGMEGIFHATITLVFTGAMPELVTWLSSLTGGAQGMNMPALPRVLQSGGLELGTPVWLLLALAVLAGFHLLGLSGWGARSLLCAADQRVAASSRLRPTRLLTGVEAIAAALSGLAGALTALDTGYINPTQFGLGFALLLVAAVLIAGGWTAIGMAAATLVVVVVPLAIGQLSGWPPILFGSLLTVLILFAPDGVDGLLLGATRLAEAVRARAPAGGRERKRARAPEPIRGGGGGA